MVMGAKGHQRAKVYALLETNRLGLPENALLESVRVR
jgi:hypothetical protein